MAVYEDGSISGTIGGGRVEHVVTEAGVEVAGGGEARRVTHHLVRDLAMCCGGSMELYIEPLAPSQEAIAGAVRSLDERRPARLITPLSGEPKWIEELSEMPGAALQLFDDRFVEPVRPRERVIVFGAGHVARRVVPLAAGVGFEVVICDDGETGELDDPPPADLVVDSFDWRDVERALGPLGAGDYVVILTRDHAVDQEILERALAAESLTYLGVIGSLGKIGRFKKRLAAKSLAGEERWQRISAPIGVDIAAETPEEIAVSIVAELIARRNTERVRG